MVVVVYVVFICLVHRDDSSGNILNLLVECNVNTLTTSLMESPLGWVPEALFFEILIK